MFSFFGWQVFVQIVLVWIYHCNMNCGICVKIWFWKLVELTPWLRTWWTSWKSPALLQGTFRRYLHTSAAEVRNETDVFVPKVSNILRQISVKRVLVSHSVTHYRITVTLGSSAEYVWLNSEEFQLPLLMAFPHLARGTVPAAQRDCTSLLVLQSLPVAVDAGWVSGC